MIVAPEVKIELQGTLERTGGATLLESLGEECESEMLHCERVGDIAMHVMAESGARDDRIQEAGFSGTLHDIGKIDPKVQAIIGLTRGLSLEEREEVRQRHTSLGASMIRALEVAEEDKSLKETAAIVALYHHHKLEDFLSLVAVPDVNMIRIIQMSDMFDAMQDRERPYHMGRAFSAEQALEAMEALLKNRRAFDSLAENTLRILKAMPEA